MPSHMAIIKGSGLPNPFPLNSHPLTPDHPPNRALRVYLLSCTMFFKTLATPLDKEIMSLPLQLLTVLSHFYFIPQSDAMQPFLHFLPTCVHLVLCNVNNALPLPLFWCSLLSPYLCWNGSSQSCQIKDAFAVMAPVVFPSLCCVVPTPITPPMGMANVGTHDGGMGRWRLKGLWPWGPGRHQSLFVGCIWHTPSVPTLTSSTGRLWLSTSCCWALCSHWLLPSWLLLPDCCWVVAADWLFLSWLLLTDCCWVVAADWVLLTDCCWVVCCHLLLLNCLLSTVVSWTGCCQLLLADCCWLSSVDWLSLSCCCCCWLAVSELAVVNCCSWTGCCQLMLLKLAVVNWCCWS